ncbi:MAG: trypsin-like peptidase domain-containing protein [Cytophagales bacterium]|nr:trypsin-like peptidase domain-containing protein [Rhizobacter sp.]
MTTTRGAACCAALALVVGAAGAHTAARPEVAALLQRADTALAQGQSGVAQAAFEQAAALQHAAHIEVGWVRARMQGGGYRQAIAFAAHAAGAHPDEAEGAILYARLLSLGGQQAAAEATLARARQRLPGDPGLGALTPADSCRPVARDATADATHDDLSPPTLGDAVPRDARVVGSALLLDDARHALVPAGLVAGEGTLWVRNGLGRTRQAEVVSRDDATGTALLKLAEALDLPVPLTRAPRAAFPGSPAHAVGYRSDGAGRPAWPQLCTGFLGAPPREGGARALGIVVSPGTAGAPVYDGAGRLVGIVSLGSGDSKPGLISAHQLGTIPVSADAPNVPLDEIYERALRSSLQLIRSAVANK